MGYPVKQGQTAQPLVFLLVSSTDHITGLTGAAPVVKISKNGAAGVSPAGAVSEIDATNLPGWYKVAGNATDTGTLGPLLLHATATGADPTDDRFDVVAYDPQATSLGLSLAKGTNITGLNDIPATAIVSGGAINTSAGAVSSVITTTTATTVTNPVTVGNNTDKTGYALASPPPTAVAIRTELDTNSTKLAFLTGDAFAIVNDPVFGNAQLVRSKTPANSLSVGADNTAYVNVLKWLSNTPPTPTTAGVPTVALAAVPPTSSQIAAAVFDLATTGHTTSGTFGAAVVAAGSAGDPWSTTLPGAYAIGTAGYIIGHNIDAAMTSRMATYTQPAGFLAATFPATVASTTNITAASGVVLSGVTHTGAVIPRVTLTDTCTTNTDMRGTNNAMLAGSYTAPDNASIAAIKTKTDNLPASPAAVGSAMTVDMTQAVPMTNTAGTLGDCLNAARADGFGKWVKSGTTLTLYGPDGTTAVRVFNLDDAIAPTTRS